MVGLTCYLQIKYYLEGNGKHVRTVDSLLSKAVADISENWIQADKYNMRKA
jgi:hypothetical protein